MNAFAWSGLLIVLTSLPVGLIVFLHQPGRLLNRFFALFALAVSIWGLGSFVIGLGLTPGIALLVWKLALAGVIFIPVFFYHVVTLLCGLKRDMTLCMVYTFGIISLLTSCMTPFLNTGVRFVFGLHYITAGPLLPLFLIGWIGIVTIAHYELLEAYKTADNLERKRLRLFFLGVLVGFSGGSMNYLPMFGINIFPWGNCGIPMFALITAYAIFAHQLMDVEIIIRRTLMYSLLAAIITGMYLVMVLIMEKWFQGFFGYRSLFATLFIAFIISIFFNPVRGGIQALVDRALLTATPTELAEQRDQLLVEVRRSAQMKAVGTLAAGLAHEIRNPLSSIKTFTEHLNSRYDDPEFRQKFQKLVGSEVERIDLIVRQLLEFAKPVPPRLMPLDVSQLIDETLELLSGELLKKQVGVTRSYKTHLTILGDPQQLKQVFINLILNSLHAMNGSGQLMVETELRGAELRVTVRDNGSGISENDLPHIFEPFHTTKMNGTGLGLAVVQGIIREHRGRIEATSQQGQGTSIRITLPVAV